MTVPWGRWLASLVGGVPSREGFHGGPWSYQTRSTSSGQPEDQHSKQTPITANTTYFVEVGNNGEELKEEVCLWPQKM